MNQKIRKAGPEDVDCLAVSAVLMKPVLDICDNEHYGAYLECSKETNIDFYRRSGFQVIKKFSPYKTSPPLWLMWRKPKEPSSVPPKQRRS